MLHFPKRAPKVIRIATSSEVSNDKRLNCKGDFVESVMSLFNVSEDLMEESCEQN